MKSGYMYILECKDGSYYTGSTTNLKARLEQHENGEGAKFTISYLPVKLVYTEKFELVSDAFKREKQIQNWSHSKKKALVEGNIEELKRLSKKQF